MDHYNILAFQGKEYIPLIQRPESSPSHNPLISIVVPAYNTPDRYLQPLVYSIVSQAYENWELILVDASNKIQASEHIQACSAIDSRIKVVKVANEGISRNTNAGIRKSTGEWVAFVDHDDVLEVDALWEVAKLIDAQPQLDVIYTDEDKISDDGERYFNPHYKPEWSPSLLREVNYITHLLVVKKEKLQAVNLLDYKKDSAQDYDLLLKLADIDAEIGHVPKILYHWRAAIKSTADNFSAKPQVLKAGVEALQEHINRKKLQAKIISKTDRPGFYEIQYQPQPKVTLLIAPFANEVILSYYIELLLNRTSKQGVDLDMLVPKSLDLLLAKHVPKLKISYVASGSSAELADSIVGASDCIVMFTNVFLPTTKDWLKLTGQLQHNEIGLVCPVITDDHDIITDAGLVSNELGLLPLFTGLSIENTQTLFGATEWQRNIAAVNGGVAAFHKKDLLRYLQQQSNTASSPKVLLSQFSQYMTASGRYNAVATNVKFGNKSIRLAEPRQQDRGFFTTALYSRPGSFEINTPDQAAAFILERLKEEE